LRKRAFLALLFIQKIILVEKKKQLISFICSLIFFQNERLKIFG